MTEGVFAWKKDTDGAMPKQVKPSRVRKHDRVSRLWKMIRQEFESHLSLTRSPCPDSLFTHFGYFPKS